MMLLQTYELCNGITRQVKIAKQITHITPTQDLHSEHCWQSAQFPAQKDVRHIKVCISSNTRKYFETGFMLNEFAQIMACPAVHNIFGPNLG